MPEDTNAKADADIPSDGLKHDWELLDKYQSFAAELLRLSLAGVAAVGFLVAAIAGEEGLLQVTGIPLGSRVGFAVALIALGLCAGAALGHRFVSSDGMACHISLLRMRIRGRSDVEIEQERHARNRRFKQSGILLWLSGAFLGGGAMALVVAFIGLLNK